MLLHDTLRRLGPILLPDAGWVNCEFHNPRSRQFIVSNSIAQAVPVGLEGAFANPPADD
jgi:hypothetical protein